MYQRKVRLMGILSISLVISACSVTVGKLSPQPTAAIPDGRYALVLEDTIVDVQKPGPGAVVKDFRATLAAGFHNMMGKRSTTSAADRPITLVLEQCDLRIENANVTRYVRASVRGHWLAPDGTKIIDFAGKVTTPNPLSNGPSQINGLVESIYESIMSEYNDELSGRPRKSFESDSAENAAMRYY